MATDERAGAEIVYGKEACDQFSSKLMKEIGFPNGVLPTGELEECGRVRATGFVWWKCKEAYEHFSVPTNSKTSYAAETTAYVEKGRMKKMTGVKTKQIFMWVPVGEMYIDGNKIKFKASIGVGKSFPLISFMNEEEKKIYLQQNGFVHSNMLMNIEDGSAAAVDICLFCFQERLCGIYKCQPLFVCEAFMCIQGN